VGIGQAVIIGDHDPLPSAIASLDLGEDHAGSFGSNHRRLPVTRIQLNQSRDESRPHPVPVPPFIQLSGRMIAVAGGKYIRWGIQKQN
jgi:hypothetical protein